MPLCDTRHESLLVVFHLRVFSSIYSSVSFCPHLLATEHLLLLVQFAYKQPVWWVSPNTGQKVPEFADSICLPQTIIFLYHGCQNYKQWMSNWSKWPPGADPFKLVPQLADHTFFVDDLRMFTWTLAKFTQRVYQPIAACIWERALTIVCIFKGSTCVTMATRECRCLLEGDGVGCTSLYTHFFVFWVFFKQFPVFLLWKLWWVSHVPQGRFHTMYCSRADVCGALAPPNQAMGGIPPEQTAGT